MTESVQNALYTLKKTQYTEPELKQRYCDAMGSELGQLFHHLMQEAAFLHLKGATFEAVTEPA